MFLQQMLSHRFWFVLIAVAIITGFPSFIRNLVRALLTIRPEHNTEGRTHTMTPEQEKWAFGNIQYLRSRIDEPETDRLVRSEIRPSRLPGGFLLLAFIALPLACLLIGTLGWVLKWFSQFHF